jgi:hypothetical protein
VSADTLQIDLEPISPPVILLPPDAVAIRLLARGEPVLGRATPVFVGPEGEYKYTGDDRGLRYEVLSRGAAPIPPEPLDLVDRARYLTLPQRLPDRVAELARAWAAGGHSQRSVALAVERHLRTEYRYDLDSPSGAAKNPLDHFLFESKRGHCEFYSTAMAVMLRTLGVPTRNVTGFVGGTYNRFGRFYAVRQGDAHSWIEVYLDGSGWTLFDPTPPASAAPQAQTSGIIAMLRDIAEAAAQRWSRYVVGYNLDQQLRLLRWVAVKYGASSAKSGILGLRNTRTTLALLALLAAVGGGTYYYVRRRRRAPALAPGDAAERQGLQIVTLYRALDAVMITRGVARVQSTPPLAHAQGLIALSHPIGPEVLELTELYLEVRYAGRALRELDRKEYLRRVRALRQAPPPATAPSRAPSPA